jgi:hypothetical protein
MTMSPATARVVACRASRGLRALGRVDWRAGVRVSCDPAFFERQHDDLISARYLGDILGGAVCVMWSPVTCGRCPPGTRRLGRGDSASRPPFVVRREGRVRRRSLKELQISNPGSCRSAGRGCPAATRTSGRRRGTLGTTIATLSIGATRTAERKQPNSAQKLSTEAVARMLAETVRKR